MLMPVISTVIERDKIRLTLGPWESYGRRRTSVMYRGAAGSSTIHVRDESIPDANPFRRDEA